MGFKDLFKVRQPGHGNSVQKKFENAASAKVSVTNKGNGVPNGGEKKAVS